MPRSLRTRPSVAGWAAIVAALIIGSSCPAFAQTATPSSKFAWDEPGQALATAQGAGYNLYIDALPPAAATGVTCTLVAPATVVTCQIPFPALTPGAHTLTVSQVIGGVESTKGTPALSVQFVILVTPTNLRVIP